MNRLPRSIHEKLGSRKQKDAFRELIDLSGFTDFFSNDYLGLAKWRSQIDSYLGSTGSRLISGNLNSTEKIEQELAETFNAEAGLLFNSGYDANLGLLSSVPQKGDTVIYDQLVHASIRDGIRLGVASSFSFEHNDVKALNDKLSRAKGEKYVVIESVYSMDGDEAPLELIDEMCKKHGAHLIVDEAHAGGVFGPNGAGLVTEKSLDDAVFAKVITFGKGFGSHGAVVLGSSELRDYLINFARSFIYTTAISPHAQERILMAVKKAIDSDAERAHLHGLIHAFKLKLSDCPFNLLESKSPIQCLVIPGNKEAKALADKVLAEKIAVKAILSPTVSGGSERLRFCLHSYNTLEEIEKLAKILNV